MNDQDWFTQEWQRPEYHEEEEELVEEEEELVVDDQRRRAIRKPKYLDD